MLPEIPPEKKPAAERKNQKDEDSSAAQQIHNQRSVLTGLRIVVIAEQENLIDRRADAVVRSLDQRKLQIFGLIVDAVQVAREMAIGREHHNAARVDKHLMRGIVAVMKSNRLHQRLNRILSAGKKVPACDSGFARIAV